MTMTIVLCVLAVLGISALAATCLVLAFSLRSRSESDSRMFEKLSDQLVAHSDFQIERMKIDADRFETREKARVAENFTRTMAGGLRIDPTANGFAAPPDPSEIRTEAR